MVKEPNFEAGCIIYWNGRHSLVFLVFSKLFKSGEVETGLGGGSRGGLYLCLFCHLSCRFLLSCDILANLVIRRISSLRELAIMQFGSLEICKIWGKVGQIAENLSHCTWWYKTSVYIRIFWSACQVRFQFLSVALLIQRVWYHARKLIFFFF